jgi:hypothetical protein
MSWFKRRKTEYRSAVLFFATAAARDQWLAQFPEAGLEHVGASRQGEFTYIVSRCDDVEKAKAFLVGKEVTERLEYWVVETPAGNWGKDIDGLYLEHLLPWQRDIAAAEFPGVILALSGHPDTLVAAARHRNDNFVVRISCGKCAHEWLDAVRYLNLTVVLCPVCTAANLVNSKNFTVEGETEPGV